MNYLDLYNHQSNAPGIPGAFLILEEVLGI